MENNYLQFKDMFIQEAKELLTNLERDLLELEKNAEDKELIEAVFRAMHTLKGVSSMYGFNSISDYTHSFESIYQGVRDELTLLTKEIFDLTFQSIDHIRNLLQDADLQNKENADRHKILLNNVKSVVEKINKTAAELPIELKKDDLHKKKERTWYIQLRTNDIFEFRGIKMVNIFYDLSELGTFEIIKNPYLVPYQTEHTEYWGIFFNTSAKRDEIEEVLMFILDDCKIIKVSDFNLFDNNLETHTDNEKGISILDAIEKEFKKPDEEEALLETIKNNNSFKNETIKEVSKQLTSRISVSSDKLDTLNHLVSELVTTNSELSLAIRHNQLNKIIQAGEKVEKLSKLFRENALEIRLVPVKDMLVRFKRLVRDLSLHLGKKVDFKIQGEDTELDKSLIDALAEPLMHLIRNCLDHGIEIPTERIKKNKPDVGILNFSAYQAGNSIIIKISDDGSGMDPEVIKRKAIEKGFISSDHHMSTKEIYDLIFLPGFSTAQNLTEVSGRGVGMDVVRRRIQDIRGDVEIESKVGGGTTFTIQLQQTISIIDTLLIRSAKTYFLIPLDEIEVCDQRDSKEIFKSQNKYVELNQTLIPYIHLRSEFNLEQNNLLTEKVIFIYKNENRFALITDHIVGEYQAVIKPLQNVCMKSEFLCGASIMGDGNLALMLDTSKLIKSVFHNQIEINQQLLTN
jgi:two-component system, chemotaxis family, sensor kinase CheA